MATSGPGLVGSRQIVLAARRLRVTFDAGQHLHALNRMTHQTTAHNNVPPKQHAICACDIAC